MRHAQRDAIAAALLRGAGCRPVPGKGRGTLYSFPLDGDQAYLRRYRRGGLVGKLMRHAYLFDNRPRREFDLHRELQGDGFPVAPLLGVVWEQMGPRTRGAIATGAVTAPNLLEWLQAAPVDPEATLRDCGAVIRRFHDAGVDHADLQLKNILVAESGPMLIDFDNARRFEVLPDRTRRRNLLRLRRSFERHRIEPHFATLISGYGPVDFPAWLDAAYRLRGRVSDWRAPESQKENEGDR